MIYKCLNCGGALKFDPTSEKMYCEYCVSYFEMDELEQKTENSPSVAEELASGSEALAEDGVADDDYMECNIYRCSSCGGELMVNGLESSTFCAYCGQPTIVFDRVSKELKPEYIVPFSVTKEEAVQAIRHKLNEGKFVPDEIKNFETERIRGIYIPYWLCDMDYEDIQSLTGTVGSGKNKKTRYYLRGAKTSFTNITLDASKRLSDETSQRLEPYNTDVLEPFHSGYLSGYYADRYDVSDHEIKGLAMVRAKKLFDQEVIKTVKADNVTILDCKPKFYIKDMTYVLLPAWFLTFRYEDEPYTFLVNGQSKKVVGGVPYRKNLILSLIAFLGTILSFFAYFITYGLFNTDSEDAFEMVFVILVGSILAFLNGRKKFDKVKESVELSKSKVMLNFVKERQKEN